MASTFEQITFLPHVQRKEYDGSNNVIYHGEAERGTSVDADRWRINKYTYTGANVTLIEVGFGSWTNRATLTYA